jgi:kinetochore protein Nuf2
MIPFLIDYLSQRLARAAQINDFSFKDLSSPDPERTRGHLSAFINFVKFSEQRADFIMRLRDKSARTNEERDKVVQALRVAEKEVAAIKSVSLSSTHLSIG